MEFKAAKRMLNVLPRDQYSAKTVAQIAEQLYDATDPTTTQRVRRDLRYLVDVGVVNKVERSQGIPKVSKPPVKGKTTGKKARIISAYCLVPDVFISWLMSESIAIQVLLSTGTIARTLGAVPGLETLEAEQIATRVLNNATREIQRIHDKIRVVPDGIGRAPATTDPAILQAAVDAIRLQRRVDLEFPAKKGGTTRRQGVTIQGLVSKDGALYLVGTCNLSDEPRLYALQRVSNLMISSATGSSVREIDLDKFLDEALAYGSPIPINSFPLKANPTERVEFRSAERPEPIIEWVDLRLRVAPRALFHFRERKVKGTVEVTWAPDQRDYGRDEDPGTWGVVVAKMPYTVQLLPFLLSLGQWIRVESPESIREQMRTVVGGMVEHY